MPFSGVNAILPALRPTIWPRGMILARMQLPCTMDKVRLNVQLEKRCHGGRAFLEVIISLYVHIMRMVLLHLYSKTSALLVMPSEASCSMSGCNDFVSNSL